VDRGVPALGGRAVSEYQYYEFLALDRPLTAAEQSEVRQLSTRARITATSFSNEYHWGDFRGSPDELMRRYYDAHLYFANWGTHRVMFRLARTLLSPKTAEQYCAGPCVTLSVTRAHVILGLTSEEEPGDWEDYTGSLSAIAAARSELATGDLRPLYLAWLSAYGAWERDEDAFDEEDEDVVEPPVPAGLRSLTAPQRALADFLRVDADLLEVAAEASPVLAGATDDPRALATYIAGMASREKDRLLRLVAGDQAARARGELLRGFRGKPAGQHDDSGSQRTVAGLLDAAAERRQQREQREAAIEAEQKALGEQQRAAARQKHLDELAQNTEAAWAEAEALINARVPARYDVAVALLKDLHELAQRGPRQSGEFHRRYMALREKHHRKPSLIARLDQAALTAR
jgi:hypothetical protein